VTELGKGIVSLLDNDPESWTFFWHGIASHPSGLSFVTAFSWWGMEMIVPETKLSWSDSWQINKAFKRAKYHVALKMVEKAND
jgi:hypothetical protein